MVLCPFVLFIFAIVLSVLLQHTDSDYPCGIFKLFFTFYDVSEEWTEQMIFRKYRKYNRYGCLIL